MLNVIISKYFNIFKDYRILTNLNRNKMKKASLVLLICLSIFSSSFSQSDIGIVKKIQGLLIFTDNEPIANYIVYGEISIGVAESSDP